MSNKKILLLDVGSIGNIFCSLHITGKVDTAVNSQRCFTQKERKSPQLYKAKLYGNLRQMSQLDPRETTAFIATGYRIIGKEKPEASSVRPDCPQIIESEGYLSSRSGDLLLSLWGFGLSWGRSRSRGSSRGSSRSICSRSSSRSICSRGSGSSGSIGSRGSGSSRSGLGSGGRSYGLSVLSHSRFDGVAPTLCWLGLRGSSRCDRLGSGSSCMRGHYLSSPYQVRRNSYEQRASLPWLPQWQRREQRRS